MKRILLLVIAALSIATTHATAGSGDVDIRALTEGNVSRNIPAAKKRAATEKKPLLWIIYDPTFEEMSGSMTKNQWCLQCFFGTENTRKLAANETVQVIATNKQPDAASYWDSTAPTREPIIVITDADGNLLHTLRSNLNPNDAQAKLKAALGVQ